MASISNTLPSSLLPWLRDEEKSDTLKSILGRIHDERGHFRHITEDTLQAEINALDNGESSADSEDDEDAAESEEVDGKSRREELYAARAEMLPLVSAAQNEALTALDFVSLLLSKDAPKQAELTMSPYLKQHIKPGTLAMDAWQRMGQDKELQTTDDTIARGWRMQSLQASADSLLGAATRLEKDVRRETQYWEQVLSVSEKGWSISRMPRERHNLGVRYGFLEALGEFRDRGLAALRADESGNVMLDKGFGNNPKAVRVRIQQGAEIVGSSPIASISDESETTLEARIRNARDSLYEEELFHEMTGESRTLASYGVVMQSSSIRLPMRLSADAPSIESNSPEILIELVSLSQENAQKVGNASQDSLAEAIALSFRLLLSYTHRDRLKRRSELPPPLTTAKKVSPVASILRPILKVVQHRSLLQDVNSYLVRLRRTLESGSIQASLTTATFDAAFLDQAGSMEGLMEKVMTPLQSRCALSVRVPSRDENLEFQLEMRTAIAAPSFGSEMTVTCPVGLPSAELSNMKDLVEFLDATVASTLGRGIADMLPGWTLHERTASVSKAGSSERIVVEILSSTGVPEEAPEGSMTLTVRGRKSQWSPANIKQEKRFWEVVGEIHDVPEK
ncbi:hypothetical protein MBLNU459_g2078t1 [Dothideomycetes sp. NU459]